MMVIASAFNVPPRLWMHSISFHTPSQQMRQSPNNIITAGGEQKPLQGWVSAKDIVSIQKSFLKMQFIPFSSYSSKRGRTITKLFIGDRYRRSNY